MTKEETRKIYNAVVRFKEYTEGTVTIAAFDDDDAREKIARMFDNKESFELLDLYDLSSVPELADFEAEIREVADQKEKEKVIN